MPTFICAAWDFFPTFCELAGVAVPEGRNGISILPTLTSKDQPEHAFLYWEFHTKQGIQAVRMGDWKGIRFNAGIDADAPIQLFNLARDLGETKDVAAKHPDVVHDSVVCTRRWNDHDGRDMDLWRLSDLMSIVHGTPPIVKFMGDDTPHVLKEEFKTVRKLYMRTFRDVCGWHEQIGFDEMTGHRFLSKDRLVQETRFSSGQAVVVNFRSAVWDDPRGFRVPSLAFHQFLVTTGEGYQ